jgi:hypothetical protein
MRYETMKSFRIAPADASWLEAVSAKHALPESKLMRLGLSMLREAWSGDTRRIEFPQNEEQG